MAASPAWIRQLLALSLLLVALGTPGGLALLPFALARIQSAKLQEIERHITDLSRRLPQRESLLAQERLLRDDAGQDRLLLRGSTVNVAAARLQGDLTALAKTMGAVVTSVQILEPMETQRFRKIGLRLSLIGDISAMRGFLYAVETRKPVLLLRFLSLDRDDGSEAVLGGTERLLATMDIHGFMTINDD